ncbi:MAG: Fe-S protein assembly co-chaperone HscB [Phycisphaerae bacterium]|jgi:molecular chaperone HscB
MDDTTPTIPIKCLKCEKELGSPVVCTECRTLYPTPRSADYFDLLGLTRSYSIDEAQLDAAFRALTRNIHPDRFSDQPNEVRALSTRLSAEINEAYVILKSPVQRAAYMLESAGGPSSAAMRDVPGDLLTEVMMIREQIEEASAAGDKRGTDGIRESLMARRADFMDRIADRADQLAACSDDEKKDMRRWLNAVKYLDNLLDELVVDPLATTTEATHGRA